MWRVNARTGAKEWVPDPDNSPQNNTGSFTPEAAASQPVGTPTSPITPRGQGGDPSLMQSWYDPSAATLGQRPGFAGEQYQKYDQRAQAADARQAPRVDYQNADQSRWFGNEGRGLYAQRALGFQSPAQLMMLEGLGRGMGANVGAAASARGGPQMQAMAARNAVGQNLDMYTGGMNEYQRLRAQEMEAGRNKFFESTSGQRGIDIQRGQFGSDLELQQRAANDARMLGFSDLGQRTLENERDALIRQQELLFGNTEGAMSQQAQAEARQAQERQRSMDAALRATEGFGRAGMQVAGSQQPQPPRKRNPYDPYDPGY